MIVADGGYDLEVIYSCSEELVMDVLRYDSEVEVVSPPALREWGAKALREAMKRYL